MIYLLLDIINSIVNAVFILYAVCFVIGGISAAFWFLIVLPLELIRDKYGVF